MAADPASPAMRRMMFRTRKGVGAGIPRICSCSPFESPDTPCDALSVVRYQPENPDPQRRSKFFLLPRELRVQIETEYLAEYLREAAARWQRLGGPSWNGYARGPACVAPSPLSLSCRRMYDGDMVPRGSMGLFWTAGPGQPHGPCRIALVVEGRLCWRRLERLRFVNEADRFHTETWKNDFFFTLGKAWNLKELELVWGPKVTILPDPRNDEHIMRQLQKHTSLRIVRFRGNVPRAWLLKESSAGSRIKYVIQPLWWVKRDWEDEEQEDLQRAADEEVHSKRVERIQKQSLGGDTSNYFKCGCYFAFMFLSAAFCARLISRTKLC
ncbi:unnamed protein product [Clonostachys chloroleuca]|uniref:Uncharacterized protein n=1 Tax=Clonostachys chloroleuca TaxID=1926264 RepID=A0AA35LSA5_9HYPO|nr:unnamed protein product [Clonostachys chloroleuca]